MEEFQNVIINTLKEVLGAGYRVIGNTMTKTNDEVLHSITIIRENEKISKNIYLEDYYKKYPEESIDVIVDEIIALYREEDDVINECLNFVESISNYENLKDNIYMKLVNKESNSLYLQDKIFMEYLDFAMLFYVLIGQKDGGSLVVTVTQVLKDLWKVGIEELYNQALKNMTERDVPVIKNINKLLVDMLDENVAEEIGKGLEVYVMSNKNNNNGAITMIFHDTLKAFAEENNTDEVIIIPSSVHEVLLYPKKSGNEITEEICLEMLLDVNDTVLKKSEFLSNNIYVYNAKCNEVKIWNE